MRNILLLGGGGYIGVVVAKFFLKKGFKVSCVDNFIYNHLSSIKNIKNKKNFILFKCDLTNKKNYRHITNSITDVVILAGLVGDPITKKYPKTAEKINYTGIKKFINFCKNKKEIKKLIFISTCSNYGLIKNKIANENTRLNPQSLYAKQKIKIEKYLINQSKNFNFDVFILRFATAFGHSERPRFDLTVNEFVLMAMQKKVIDIYDSETWRPYCHVQDFAKVIYYALIKKSRIKKTKIFNVGSNKNNFRKIDIIHKIKKYIPSLKYKDVQSKNDPRNYIVNFNKIRVELGIKKFLSLDYGIKEMIFNLRKIKKIKFIKKPGNFFIK